MANAFDEMTVEIVMREKSADDRLKELARIGELVLRLPLDESLTNGGDHWIVEDAICGHSWGATPEEALRKFFEAEAAT